MYPQSLLAEIKRRLTLSELIGKTVQLRKKGHEYHGLCPFHQEKTPSFTVNNGKEFYHCFGCGQHGSVFDFLIHQNHLTFIEAVKHAAEMAGVTLPRLAPSHPEEDQTKQTLEQILEHACQFFEHQLASPDGKEALNYLLRQRNLVPATLKKFRLGVSASSDKGLLTHLLAKGHTLDQIKMAGLLSEWDDGSWHDKFRHRIMFPILDRKSKVIAFGGRLLGPGEPKYLNSPETPVFHKGHTLYNWPHAQQSAQKKDPLVVVEGYMDVISLAQHGYERVVAPLGTALTEEQIQLLWKLCAEPVLCFDGDEAGQRAARRAAERAIPFLKPGRSLSFLTLPAFEDPDTFIQKEGLARWYALFQQAQPLVNLLWETEIRHYLRKTPEEKALLEKTLEDFCLQIQDPAVKNYYKQEFKNRLFLWNAPSKRTFSKSKPLSPKKIDVILIQERILLASILLNPALEEHIHEEFTLLQFQTPAHADIQKKIINYFSENNTLEKETLTSYLINYGYEKTLQTILATDLFIHAPFLRLSTLDLILESWNQVHQLYGQKLGEKEELEHAKERLRTTLSSEEWQRYKRLKESFVLSDEQKEE
ncbi:MAG: primase protein [Berkelbacteria bacterium GW2011_GWA2_46_7]|uniref:DNA primase n=1 Tax=Berkelbacteria bacterium GW2011_GWA2_46_7 TaxID=1618335 RepID=A0A0G1SN73_9BACT|nr:MAG: primase protein [Berkelbacteria bacterium GW2011_GWA2_46_7]HCI48395.1 DNA primase [Holosporales bacterium]